MEIITALFISTGVLVLFLLALIFIGALMPPRREDRTFVNDGDEIDSIKHQVEREGAQEAEEELMPYKPPRLDSPRQRRRI